jgi:hypothetical protein
MDAKASQQITVTTATTARPTHPSASVWLPAGGSVFRGSRSLAPGTVSRRLERSSADVVPPIGGTDCASGTGAGVRDGGVLSGSGRGSD